MSKVIFSDDKHKNIFLVDFAGESSVQSNIHLIIHDNKGIILDPGGHKVFNEAVTNLISELQMKNLEYIFFSHQDPDIVASANGWLMSTDAQAWCPSCWTRFIPHFGFDKFVTKQLNPIPDKGMLLDLNGCQLMIIPAHHLHSVANFQLYDPYSKILYSGDLGTSLGIKYREVRNFEGHLQYMQNFHKRYMVSNTVVKKWANMVRQMDIEMIVPQHGAFFIGKEMVTKFIDWCEKTPCGIDLMQDIYKIPEKK